MWVDVRHTKLQLALIPWLLKFLRSRFSVGLPKSSENSWLIVTFLKVVMSDTISLDVLRSSICTDCHSPRNKQGISELQHSISWKQLKKEKKNLLHKTEVNGSTTQRIWSTESFFSPASPPLLISQEHWLWLEGTFIRFLNLINNFKDWPREHSENNLDKNIEHVVKVSSPNWMGMGCSASCVLCRQDSIKSHFLSLFRSRHHPITGRNNRKTHLKINKTKHLRHWKRTTILKNC